MCDAPRELSATETAITSALTGAGYTAHRCMDAWTSFERDGRVRSRSVIINWTTAGEVESVEGLTIEDLLLLLVPPAAGEHTVDIPVAKINAIRDWMARPNGSIVAGRVSFNSVEGGGVMVRTQPHRAW